jgi:hypothetical protein
MQLTEGDGMNREDDFYTVNQKGNLLSSVTKITLWILVSIICGYYFIIGFTGSQDLWVQNNTNKTILIKNCNLNNESINNCFLELKNKGSVFIKPHKILFFPKINKLSIKVIIDKNEYHYSCDFYRKKSDCIEEVSIENDSLSCTKYCSSVYD